MMEQREWKKIEWWEMMEEEEFGRWIFGGILYLYSIILKIQFELVRNVEELEGIGCKINLDLEDLYGSLWKMKNENDLLLQSTWFHWKIEISLIFLIRIVNLESKRGGGIKIKNSFQWILRIKLKCGNSIPFVDL